MRFGEFGGKYVPETLIPALAELEESYNKLKDDSDFKKELEYYLKEYAGRPTPLYFAKRLSEKCGAEIYLKREDLLHTGAHKINNTLGQVMLAKRMGKKRVIAETGAGQHGVATATAASMLGLECEVYMGKKDIERQKLNVFRMKLLGAKVVEVEAGSQTLKDAVNDALRDYTANFKDTHYVLGSTVGPHPYPTIVRDFQSVIGVETKEQIKAEGKKPDYLVACVGGGSNALGLFYPFVNDEVKMIGVEAGGTGEKHAARLCGEGKKGVMHGMMSYLLSDKYGQIMETHSVSAGLDYSAVGPEHSYLKDKGRAEYVSVKDDEALKGFHLLAETEGIIPALESSHAIYYAYELGKKEKGKMIVVNLSGRGDKDVQHVAKVEGKL